MDIVDFKNRAQCLLTEDITSTQTTLPVGPGCADFAPVAGHKTLAVIRDAVGYEVVFVTSVSATSIVVERGRDGSVQKAFKAGALISMRLVKGSFTQFGQHGVIRQISYNPNKVLLPAYYGEKVAEIGVDGCTHRIWQNVIDRASSWRIVYGDMCKDFTNWRDWDWCYFNIDWGSWPIITISPPYNDGTGYDPELMSLIFSDENELYAFYSASFIAAASGSVSSIVDQSGTGLDCAINEGPYIPAKIETDGKFFYRFTMGSAYDYFNNSTNYSSDSVGKFSGNSYFVTCKFSTSGSGPAVSTVTLPVGGGKLEIYSDGGAKLFNNTTVSEEYFYFPVGEYASLVSVRANDDGSTEVKLNGETYFSGNFSTEGEEDAPIGSLIEASYYVPPDNGGSTIYEQSGYFDVYDHIWFKNSLTEEMFSSIESGLLSFYGITT